MIPRRSRPRKRRKTSLAALKRKLWALFAAYVKERDGNTCFSCGAGAIEGANWHAGHLFNAGGHSNVRYHPKNVHSQCGRCNCWLGGNGAAYALRFLDKYGPECMAQLDRLSRPTKAWKAHEVEDMIVALKTGGADYELLHAQRYEI